MLHKIAFFTIIWSKYRVNYLSPNLRLITTIYRNDHRHQKPCPRSRGDVSRPPKKSLFLEGEVADLTEREKSFFSLVPSRPLKLHGLEVPSLWWRTIFRNLFCRASSQAKRRKSPITIRDCLFLEENQREANWI